MNTKNEKVFASHVSAKLTKAAELGISASWTTANHLDALAEACWDVASTGGKDGIREVLGDAYNVSAFQQMLAKKFEKVPGGHFQREKSKPVSEQADDVFAMLARDVGATAKG